MREIKFRAWDTELKMMVYENEQTGDTGYETNPVKAVNTIINEDYAEYIWMQYVGVKDKNGKEIYEGDICKSVDKEFKGSIGVVKYSEKDCWFGLRIGKYTTIFIGTDFSMVEVIGNIHENPELLQVRNTIIK